MLSETEVVADLKSTRLLGNYPNPFNPTTTIKFRIENSELRIEGRGESITSVKIEIFNIKGQKLRSLVNGDYREGEHSVIWNGTDDHNSPVTSGIYFYRFTTDNYIETKKMLLIK